MHLRALVVIVILVAVLGGLCTLWMNSFDFSGSSPAAPEAAVAAWVSATPALHEPHQEQAS